jgi:hypothetical protein
LSVVCHVCCCPLCATCHAAGCVPGVLVSVVCHVSCRASSRSSTCGNTTARLRLRAAREPWARECYAVRTIALDPTERSSGHGGDVQPAAAGPLLAVRRSGRRHVAVVIDFRHGGALGTPFRLGLGLRRKTALDGASRRSIRRSIPTEHADGARRRSIVPRGQGTLSELGCGGFALRAHYVRSWAQTVP